MGTPTAPGHDETIATFEHAGRTYEIDHLGINMRSQWGSFALYCNGETIDGFDIPEAAIPREFRPAELPYTNDQLIEMARTVLTTVACTAKCTHPEGETFGHPFPGRPGYFTGRCGHAVAGSEWRAGFRNCERCGENHN